MTGRDSQGVASVAPSSNRPYVSNYIPLWAGLLSDDTAESQKVLQSFLASGEAQCMLAKLIATGLWSVLLASLLKQLVCCLVNGCHTYPPSGVGDDAVCAISDKACLHQCLCHPDLCNPPSVVVSLSWQLLCRLAAGSRSQHISGEFWAAVGRSQCMAKFAMDHDPGYARQWKYAPQPLSCPCGVRSCTVYTKYLVQMDVVRRACALTASVLTCPGAQCQRCTGSGRGLWAEVASSCLLSMLQLLVDCLAVREKLQGPEVPLPCTVEDGAASLAQTWLENNWAGWQQTGKMVEKYSAQSSGIAGGGGEYSVQTGTSSHDSLLLSCRSVYATCALGCLCPGCHGPACQQLC